jgi:hypothetical protein
VVYEASGKGPPVVVAPAEAEDGETMPDGELALPGGKELAEFDAAAEALPDPEGAPEALPEVDAAPDAPEDADPPAEDELLPPNLVGVCTITVPSVPLPGGARVTVLVVVPS